MLTRRSLFAHFFRLAFLSGMLISAVSYAATTTATFQVQITIVDECEISGTNTLDFGSHGVLSANVDATTTFNVQCTLNTPFDIGLDEGVGAGATVAVRRMTGPGAATVDYSLYSDSARTTVWGETIPTDTVADTGTGAAVPYTVYGRVPPQSTPGSGLYTDTITITVTF